MTKSELIKALEEFDDDAVVIIGDSDSGWCNIGTVKSDGSSIAITEDCSRPFGSD